MDLQSKALKRLSSVPWVWTIHGRYNPNEAELEQWHCALGAEALRVTAVSKATRDHFCQKSHIAPEKVTVIYSGVSLNRSGDCNINGQAGFRKILGIPDQAFVFGSCGRCVPEKAYDILLHAARLVLGKAPSCHFIIAGDGPLLNELRQLTKGLGIANSVHFLGYCSDIPLLLKSVDVFVMSSRSEALPLALIEALAAGLPCLSTNVGGIPEIMENGGGFMVPSESSEALARGLVQMLDSRFREQISVPHREIAQRFSMRKCAENYFQLYRSIISN